MLDFMFYKLGLEDDTAVRHPIVMTEIPCNINHSRARKPSLFFSEISTHYSPLLALPAGMSELLFELYRVPSVTYGIDSLFSLYFNRRQQGWCFHKLTIFAAEELKFSLYFLCTPSATSGSHLVFSCGSHASYVLPVINGRLDAANCKRSG